MKKKSRPISPHLQIPEFRFKECSDCKFFRPFNTSKTCRGCDAGENFEETIEELNPHADYFLKGSFGGSYEE